MGKWIFSVLLLLGSVGSNSHVQHLCKGFLPENSMWIPDNRAMNKGLTELEFNQLLDRLQALYAPEFAQRGATFMIERNWADGTVNAYAYQDGNDWIISMFGGMARHPAMTYDGFAAIACHEVGHHMGGAPKYSRGDWASVEGQSDYYATAKSLKR